MTNRKKNPWRAKNQNSVTPQLVSWIERHEIGMVALFIFLAGLRIFIFSAAFPPLNNVDEPAHLDLVWKYHNGDIPKQIGIYSRKAAEQIVLYGSPEYIPSGELEEKMRAGKLDPPPYRYPEAKDAKIVNNSIDQFLYMASDPAHPDVPIIRMKNHEDTQPPVYYLLAGCWLRLGRFLGIQEGFLFYWIRFLNIPLMMATVGLGYLFARRFFADSPLIRLGAPLLLAFFPQDIFYSINNDVPAALLLGGALYLGLDVYLTSSPGYPRCLGAGLLAAAAFLTKQNNFSGLAILLVLGVITIATLVKNNRARAAWGKPVALLAAAFLPTLGWLIRNKIVVGDWTGTAEKVTWLGWTPQPLADWWVHPMFSIHGLLHFVGAITVRFWRGEFVWGPGWKQGTSAMIFPPADWTYLLTSFLFLTTALIALLRHKRHENPNERIVNGVHFASLGMSVVFLAFLSVYFDFNQCFYPSRAEPFFISGRLLLGTLIPFILLYLCGLKHLLPGPRFAVWRATMLLALVLFMIGAQIYTSLPVFHSQYNWFHMW